MYMLQARGLYPRQTSRTLISLTGLFFISALLIVTLTSVKADHHHPDQLSCSDVRITDVSELTISAGAAALELNTLVSVLPSDVVALLDSSENITVFAPTDEAFAKIPGSVLDGILAAEALPTVLAYHVSPGRVDPTKAVYTKKIDSLAEQDLFISRDEIGPTVNNSSIDCQGYRTKNGLVWLIDSVLLPQFK